MNLLLIEPADVTAAGAVTLTGAAARHVTEVLKARSGQKIRVGLVDGPTGTATVGEMTASAVALSCTFDGGTPARPRLDLLLALPRPKVLRRLWAQLAALGVGHILLTNAEKVERHYFDTHVLTPDFYRPLLIEGLQQARDTSVPLVSVHRRLKVLVEDHLDGICPTTYRFVADPSGTPDQVRVKDGDARVLLAVGPEGGWNDYERALFAAHGFQTFSIGPRTLRTDTACVALLTLMHQALAARDR